MSRRRIPFARARNSDGRGRQQFDTQTSKARRLTAPGGVHPENRNTACTREFSGHNFTRSRRFRDGTTLGHYRGTSTGSWRSPEGNSKEVLACIHHEYRLAA